MIRYFLILIPLFLACHPPTKPVPTPEITTAQAPDDFYTKLRANDSLIVQKFPRFTGTWEGFGEDSGRSFSWAIRNGRLEGTYLGKKQVKEDYSKVFGFRIENDLIQCNPRCYQCGCATSEGNYALTAQTDSSFTFVFGQSAFHSTRSTLEFSFQGTDQMTFVWDHDRQDYPDSHEIRHFRRK